MACTVAARDPDVPGGTGMDPVAVTAGSLGPAGTTPRRPIAVVRCQGIADVEGRRGHQLAAGLPSSPLYCSPFRPVRSAAAPVRVPTGLSPTLDLTERLLQGDKAAIARVISWAENGDARYAATMSKLYPRVGKAWRTGITGPPGAGKSTLVNELARALRAKQRTVGILAVDPSSPYTGGALLGDRIRMEDRTLDAGVYIRSMASRGSHGGLAAAAGDGCDVLDVAGFAEVLLETVGVGQAEFDVVAVCDTVVVVVCPGAGDGVQAMKAGLLEVADVLVVNKADLPGADRLLNDLEEAVHVRKSGRSGWIPPVLPVAATLGEGLDELVLALEDHRGHLADGRLEAARRAKRLEHLRAAFVARLGERLWSAQDAQLLLDQGRAPYDVVAALLERVLASGAQEAP
jgi:LAO/AO transport system kinase